MIPGVIYHPPADWVQDHEPLTGPLFPPVGDIVEVFIHYEGLPDSVAPPSTDTQMIARLRNEQHGYVTNRKYSLGYGFSIPPDGSVWGIRQFDYRNAANAGKKVSGNANHTSFAIQLKVRGQSEASQAQIGAVRAVIGEARRRGMGARVQAHQDVDFTGCPGAGILSQVRAGVFEPQEEDEMTQDQLDRIIAAIGAVGDAATDTVRACLDLVPESYVVKPPAGRTGRWLYVEGGSVRMLTPYDSRNGPLPDGSDGVDVAMWDAMSRDAGQTPD